MEEDKYSLRGGGWHRGDRQLRRREEIKLVDYKEKRVKLIVLLHYLFKYELVIRKLIGKERKIALNLFWFCNNARTVCVYLFSPSLLRVNACATAHCTLHAARSAWLTSFRAKSSI